MYESTCTFRQFFLSSNQPPHDKGKNKTNILRQNKCDILLFACVQETCWDVLKVYELECVVMNEIFLSFIRNFDEFEI